MRKNPANARVEPASDADARGASYKPAMVEYINIGLMLLALVVASLIPFELFLFAYAVLGPLHYATEISWLYDRRFFAPRRIDALPLIACALVITLGNPDVLGDGTTQWLNEMQDRKSVV